MSEYQKDTIKAPVVGGWQLRAFVNLLETSGIGGRLVDKLTNDSGINRFRDLDPGDASPIQVPLPHPPGHRNPTSPHAMASQAAQLPTPAGVGGTTVAAFGARYQAEPSAPQAVADAAIAAIVAMDTGEARMGFFINHRPDDVRAAADASAKRYAAGAPLSVLDGVPVVIKDEIDVAGYPTTLGTNYRKAVATTDATLVARLRGAGAVILGKANMNEIGINPIGLNPHYGPARNPWDRGRITGGSSSASASTVAAGLAPIAIGADGGGSIRIPAALCGVVGLKATFGRVPETGVPPLCWNVGHAGPIGYTVADVAATYAIIAGACQHDLVSQAQPLPDLTDLTNRDLRGVRLGISWPHFQDAQPAIVAACKRAVETLVAQGAVVIDIEPPDLNTIKWAHAIIILSEMASAMRVDVRADRKRFALDSRTNLRIGEQLLATDLVHAMRHRQRITRQTLEQMKSVDLIVTPTTGITAPPIPEKYLPDGDSNLPVVDALMRFIRIGNLTGLPGIAVPCGLDDAGLPISVHMLARPWEEALLLRAASVIEALRPASVPKHYVNLLGVS